MADGNNTKKAIKIPLIIGFNFKSMVDMKNPTITHMENAEILASQVNFWRIIGITSIIPAIEPSINPNFIFFIVIYFADSSTCMTHNDLLSAVLLCERKDNKFKQQ